MKRLVCVLIVVLFGVSGCLFLSKKPVVEKYPAERVIDIDGCKDYYKLPQLYTQCALQIICDSDVIKNPKGEEYYVKSSVPVGTTEEGKVEWGEEIVTPEFNDTQCYYFCLRVYAELNKPNRGL